MSDVLARYKVLFDQFLSERITVEQFQETFLTWFKNEGPLEERDYVMLDHLFGDIDSFTTDPHLLADKPGFYLDENALRQKVRLVSEKMSAT